MNRIFLSFAVFAVLASPAIAAFDGTVGDISDNGILVGTSWNPHQDNLAAINDVIDFGDAPGALSWNNTFGPGTTDNLAALPLATTVWGKYDGVSEGSFNPDHFEFYSTTDGITFTLIADGAAFGETVVGFKYVGPAGGDAGIFYYVAKSDATTGGFSVFSYQPGMINLAYVDADGDLDTLLDARGNHDISHLSFYGIGPDGSEHVVPEPTTLAVWAMGLGCIGIMSRRRRNVVRS